MRAMPELRTTVQRVTEGRKPKLIRPPQLIILMRIDSAIVEAVMKYLMLEKGIVVLPVHDSFLVPASKRDDLEAAMIEAAHRIARLVATVESNRLRSCSQKTARFMDVFESISP